MSTRYQALKSVQDDLHIVRIRKAQLATIPRWRWSWRRKLAAEAEEALQRAEASMRQDSREQASGKA